jgi:MFS family permease
VSVFTGGAFFGAAGAGPCGDKYGRKLTILIGAAIFCLGGGLQTGAQTIAYMMAGRAFAGVGFVPSITSNGVARLQWLMKALLVSA